MLLHCTLVGQPGSAVAGPVELSIAAPSGCPGAVIQDAVSRKFGTARLSVAGVPLAALSAGAAPLVNGAVLVDGCPAGLRARTQAGPGPGGWKAPSGASLLLAVLSGPGAGTVLPVRRGRYRFGRSGTEMAIPDAYLSREHARLDVSDAGITLTDLGSANGTRIDGRQVHSAPVSTESIIGCGHSTLAVLFRGEQPGLSGPGSPGLSCAGEDTTEPLSVRGPGPAGPRTLLVLAAVLPLVAGVVLATATGMWMFLAFTAVSAVPVLLPALSGRRLRRELRAAVAAAVRQDGERRRRAAPSAAELVLGAARPGAADGHAPSAGRAPTTAGPVWLRLGLARQAANIRREPADPAFGAPPAGHLLPLTLDPSVATLLEGPAQSVAGLVRYFVMQLAGYPRAGRTWVHLHGAAPSLPLAARFLSRVSLSSSAAVTAARLSSGPGPGCDRGVLILLPGTGPGAEGGAGPRAGGADALATEAHRLGWQVIVCSAPAPAPETGQAVILAGGTGRLTRGSSGTCFVPDLVPERVFDRFCRQLGDVHRPVTAASSIPESCSLDEVLALTEAEVAARWEADRHPPGRSPGLPVPVGRGAEGPVRMDLHADGPHLLVAGTTGAGKSEFLRTLVTGLAACYPPDRVILLFVDFKGGSGLGPLTGLPHCVGLLTDLDGYEVDRTLASLRAEVRRREELLAAAGVPDLASYPAHAPGVPALPHLVLVIDEFRMLVEDAPAALTELMRIAVIGRSLGIHLVMATQRPQGALTADIRANVTSCVVLRVQSELESADIINSRLAATIPVGSPGRAYLVRGSGPPEEFQTATFSPAPPVPPDAAVTVLPAEAILDRMPGTSLPAAGPAPGATPSESAAAFAALLARLWHVQGGVPPRRPVAGPLPQTLAFPGPEPEPGPESRPEADADAGQRTGRTVLLGLVDLPEQQQVRRLGWNPDLHGHLALIGGTQDATGGSTRTLRLALDQLMDSEAESHLYLLDGDGALAAAAGSPRVGARVGPHEPARAARVLARAAEEMTRRLAAPRSGGLAPLVLVLHNWGSWVSAFRSGPLAWAEDLVADLIRDGPKAEITAVLSGERELVSARFFPALPNRIFFPAGSTEEGRLALPLLPKLPAIPGRVIVSGHFVGDGKPGVTVPRAAQLYDRPAEDRGAAVPGRGPGRSVRGRPFRIEALPAMVTADEVRSRLGPEIPSAAPSDARLWIGVGGDELRPVGILAPPGSVAAVLGGPSSGKSTLLRALPRLNQSRAWLRPDAGSRREDYWSGVHTRAVAGDLDPAAIILADDADLSGRETNAVLLELNGLGWTVVFTAGFGPALQQRVPLALKARSHGRGILLCPRSLMDGDLFGMRFEPELHPPAGRAVVISDGRAAAVQLALAPEEPP
ncbi:FHA domain-containing protein [Arthrobacter sp. KBS0702]|uniref:FtsK/SpoIIIE domain-containing protein n=1 Tax=Arthrobacter sp. KBS0702 TaxID=2578107 RepID=UPI00110ECEBE|nr:FtsK/SpoIIIE domain-containing protein [Arthrobacter sp. KBS0702]QDW30288.1 FHA domain-containing protein [Arthrobacter sp. KBS0702]